MFKEWLKKWLGISRIEKIVSDQPDVKYTIEVALGTLLNEMEKDPDRKFAYPRLRREFSNAVRLSSY